MSDRMTDLASKHCRPCEGGVDPIPPEVARAQLPTLLPAWSLSTDGKSIHRAYAFKNFYRTMSFVNAVAHIANSEDHHPDLELGYNYCRVRFTTHAIGGLSENDLICAARIDTLAL